MRNVSLPLTEPSIFQRRGAASSYKAVMVTSIRPNTRRAEDDHALGPINDLLHWLPFPLVLDDVAGSCRPVALCYDHGEDDDKNGEEMLSYNQTVPSGMEQCKFIFK